MGYREVSNRRPTKNTRISREKVWFLHITRPGFADLANVRKRPTTGFAGYRQYGLRTAMVREKASAYLSPYKPRVAAP